MLAAGYMVIEPRQPTRQRCTETRAESLQQARPISVAVACDPSLAGLFSIWKLGPVRPPPPQQRTGGISADHWFSPRRCLGSLTRVRMFLLEFPRMPGLESRASDTHLISAHSAQNISIWFRLEAVQHRLDEHPEKMRASPISVAVPCDPNRPFATVKCTVRKDHSITSSARGGATEDQQLEREFIMRKTSYPRLLRTGGGGTNRCQTAPLSNCIVRPSGENTAPSFQYSAQI
jgi:hypothetical protein